MIDEAINTVNMKTLANVAAGYPLRGSAESLESGEVRLIQMRNITSTLQVDWGTVARVSLPTKRTPQWLERGDVIFAARGARNYAVCFDELPQKAVCSPHFFVIRILDKETVLPSFLAWQINQRPAQDYFERSATGSHIPNVRRQVLEDLKVTIPPLERQKTIAALWDSLRKEERMTLALIRNRQQQMEAVAADLLQGRMR